MTVNFMSEREAEMVIDILRDKIKERGISYAELARRVGISRNKIYNSLGHNPTRTLRPEEFINIVHFLGIALDVFWTEDNNNDTDRQNKNP